MTISTTNFAAIYTRISRDFDGTLSLEAVKASGELPRVYGSGETKMVTEFYAVRGGVKEVFGSITSAVSCSNSENDLGDKLNPR